MAASARTLLVGLTALALAYAPRARADVDLWPILEITKNSTTVVYPFYVHEGNFLMVFPFYYRTNEGRDQHFLWPFVKVSDGRVSRVAPFWFSADEDHYRLFPLIDRSPEGTYLLLPPAYLSRDDKMVAVLPAYVRSRKGPGDEQGWIFWRLYGWEERPNGSSRHTAGFLFDWGSHGDDWSFSMLPLLWTWGGQGRSSFVFLPAYRTHDGDGGALGFFPLFHRGYGKDWTGLWLLPYWSSSGPGEDRQTAFLPFFWTSQERHSTAVETDLRFGWPLLYHRSETTLADGKVQSRYRRFLFFSDELEGHQRTFSILGIAVSHESE